MAPQQPQQAALRIGNQCNKLPHPGLLSLPSAIGQIALHLPLTLIQIGVGVVLVPMVENSIPDLIDSLHPSPVATGKPGVTGNDLFTVSRNGRPDMLRLRRGPKHTGRDLIEALHADPLIAQPPVEVPAKGVER